MRYALIIGAIVVVLGLFFGFLWWLNSGSSTPAPVDTVNNPTSYNNNTSGVYTQPATTSATGGQVVVTSATGGRVGIKDFTKDPRVKLDPQNPGHYHLAGGVGLAEAQAPYLIVYVDSDQSFAISIEQEPLSQTRLDAEKYLMDMLSISKNDMCLLRYSVLVPNDVNQVYSGKNLGFSFCPGAARLP